MALPSHLQVESLNAHIFQGEGSWPGGPGWSPRRCRLQAVTLPPLSGSPSRPWGVRGSSASLLLFWTLLPWAPSLYRAHWICIPRAGMASSARQAHTPMCQQLPPSLCLGRICPAQAGFPACPTHLVIAVGWGSVPAWACAEVPPVCQCCPEVTSRFQFSLVLPFEAASLPSLPPSLYGLC